MWRTGEGGMQHFYTCEGVGLIENFEAGVTAADTKDINVHFSKMNRAANTIGMEKFPTAVKDMKRDLKALKKRVPAKIGGAKGCCDEAVQSKGLHNEFHVDLDTSKCFSIWTTERGMKKIQLVGIL